MKTLKKLAFVLAVLLALGCVAPMAAMAEDTNTTVGYSVKNIASPNLTNAVDITTLADDAKPSSGKTYTISTADGLHKLSAIVNNGCYCAGVTFVQTAHIDMSTSNKAWTPIGSYTFSTNTSKDFRGTYDGQGYTISNLKYAVTEAPEAKGGIGLLFVFGRGAVTIKNVVLDNTCEVKYTGKNEKSESTNIGIPMGSIVAVYNASSGKISNCYSAATVINGDLNNESPTGGILGYYQTTAGSKFENCTFAGNLQGVSRCGGIIGWAQNIATTISNCCNIGTVASTAMSDSTARAAGGIIGAPNNTSSNLCTITNCANYGTVSSAGTPFVGGIIGIVREGVKASNNTDYGTVIIKGKEQAKNTIYGEIYYDYDTNDTDGDGDTTEKINVKNANLVDATNKVLRDADKAMFHGYQVRANGENAVDLRLVASIDGKSYSAVGMKITVTFTYNGTPVTKVLDADAGSKTTTVYNSLTAYANDEDVNYTAEALRVDEKEGFLYAVVLTGIPKAAFTSGDFTVTVTPYAVDLENAETEYTGVQAVKVITLENLPDNTVPAN